MAETTPKRVFFHVGMPKTASTFLQRNVFPHFRDVHFIKKHDFKHHKRFILQTTKDKVLLSTELDLHRERSVRKIRDIASAYPGTQPVIVLRRHSSWLKSKYKYYLRKHGTYSFWEYFGPHEEGIINHKALRYYDKLKLLESTYEKRPLVFFQEELKADARAFIAQLAEMLGTAYDDRAISIKTVKGSYSEHQLKHVRRFNRRYKFRKPDGMPKIKKFAYRKFSALLLHTVAFLGKFLPDPMHGDPLIPQASLKAVDEQFRYDWLQCLEYAAQDRTLLIDKNRY